jgi:hypothetical protein
VTIGPIPLQAARPEEEKTEASIHLSPNACRRGRAASRGAQFEAAERTRAGVFLLALGDWKAVRNTTPLVADPEGVIRRMLDYCGCPSTQRV